MEHSTPTSTGHQKVPRPPTTSTHDGLLLTHPDQQYWDSQHATDWECRAQLCCQLVTEEADAAEDLYD